MNHNDVIADLQSAQNDENDTREDCREADHFLEDKNGQWEQRVWNQTEGRPRYTFDKCNPVVDLICGPIEESSFSIKTSPANENGDKDMSLQLNSIIRGIQRESKAQAIYNRSMRRVVRSGFAALEVRTDWKPGSFNQRLLIEGIPNAIDKVWIDPASTEPDGSDAKYAFKLDFIPWSKYNKKFPRAKIKKLTDTEGAQSVDNNVQFTRYWYKPEGVTIGNYYHCKPVSKEIALLTDGSVVDIPKTDVEVVELNGMAILKRRTETTYKWYIRRFSQGQWLDKDKETVFTTCPIIPMMGCHEVIEDKRVYRGAISKLMDAQRVLNYAKSKEIEEGALQPRDKVWMDKRQAKDKSVRDQLQKMNNSADPVQFYDHVDGVPAPYKAGPAQVNPHLNNLSQSMQADIEMSAGKYAAALGQNPLNQSGRALEAQIDQSALTDTKWSLVLKGTIERVATLLVDAMPRVYDTQVSVMSEAEDGTVDTVELNVPVNNNGQIEIQNKVTSDYSVNVEIGPAYGSAAKEANAAILELAAVMPEVLQGGADVFMKNITAPGMSVLQERARQRLVMGGLIPEDQLTDDEKEQVELQKQQQNQQTDPAMVLAQAEVAKGQAEQMNAQTKQMSTQIDMMNAETKRIEALTKAQEAGVKIEGMQIDNVGKVLDNQGKVTDNQGKQLDNMGRVIGAVQ